jgi:hypothetical protein
MANNELKYYVGFPNWVTPGNAFGHHQKFAEFREWLESSVGKQGTDWQYITGNIHALGVTFRKKGDCIAFKLKFDLSPNPE